MLMVVECQEQSGRKKFVVDLCLEYLEDFRKLFDINVF